LLDHPLDFSKLQPFEMVELLQSVNPIDLGLSEKITEHTLNLSKEGI
jgi:hypothetical protein